MNESEIHIGHRVRMMNKFLSNPDAIPEHELMEMLLYDFIPRKDTNKIAHLLIRYFGSIKGVFNASLSELMTIEGVGKTTASKIVLLSKIFNKVFDFYNVKPQAYCSYEKIKQGLINRFYNEAFEKFVIILLNKKYEKITELFYEDHFKNEVTADIPEIAKAFAVNKPAFAIISHNHPSGNSSPSYEDDFTTAKINMLCCVHGVTLIDHIIIGGKTAYSYQMEHRLAYIKDKFAIENLLHKVSEE